MRKARDGLKVEYTGVNLKHLQTQPPGKVITGGSSPVRISQASVQRNLFMPSNQESTSVVDCITMPCLIQNVPARGWMEVFFFFFFFVTKVGRDWAPCCLRENKDLHDCVSMGNTVPMWLCQVQSVSLWLSQISSRCVWPIQPTSTLAGRFSICSSVGLFSGEG